MCTTNPHLLFFVFFTIRNKKDNVKQKGILEVGKDECQAFEEHRIIGKW